MPASRETTCHNAALALRAALPSLSEHKTVVGFDGFVDEIIAVVDKRKDLAHFEPVPTIQAFGEKILAAVGRSGNYELVVKQMKLGGNGPIMGNALAALGLPTTYIGAVGNPPNVHPAFAELAARAHVIPIGDPGHTDALEFADGKLMLGKYTREMAGVTWDAIQQHVGEQAFTSMMHGCSLVGMVNWTMLPFMNDIWRAMMEAGVPTRADRRRTLFVDLADPEKRTRQDIKGGLDLLTRFQEQVDVVLGLNLKEAGQVLDVLGLPTPADYGEASLGPVEEAAGAIRKQIGVSCVVVHPRAGAAAATAQSAARFLGPFVQEPKISTGAGDHFNAGFCLGWILGMGLAEALCTGTATSGYYVRSAISPGAGALAEFIDKLPPPQGG